VALMWCRRRRHEGHSGGERAWRQALRSSSVNGRLGQAGAEVCACMTQRVCGVHVCMRRRSAGSGAMHGGGAGVRVTGLRHGSWRVHTMYTSMCVSQVVCWFP
jgi:hypothetical protein